MCRAFFSYLEAFSDASFCFSLFFPTLFVRYCRRSLFPPSLLVFLSLYEQYLCLQPTLPASVPKLQPVSSPHASGPSFAPLTAHFPPTGFCLLGTAFPLATIAAAIQPILFFPFLLDGLFTLFYTSFSLLFQFFPCLQGQLLHKLLTLTPRPSPVCAV